jgi:hypothetical protein
MKVTLLLNGTSKIALIPENEIEKLVLQQIMKGDIQAQTFATLHIGDVQHADAVIVSVKKEEIIPKTVVG